MLSRKRAHCRPSSPAACADIVLAREKPGDGAQHHGEQRAGQQAGDDSAPIAVLVETA